MPEDQFNENVIRAKTNRAKEKRGTLAGGLQADMHIVQGSGPANRHGMPKLPTGQHEVYNWPVLDLGVVPNVSLDKWLLEISGEVENPYSLTWKDYMDIPQVTDISDFHCVTTWSRMDNQWIGVSSKHWPKKPNLNRMPNLPTSPATTDIQQTSNWKNA